jgi:hypothetical protein
MTRKAIPFCSFGGYRRFCSWWWHDLLWYVTGISVDKYRREMKRPWWRFAALRRPGWAADIYTYWHRARYGWAPKDTWSLDHYLNGVLAGSLVHLADHSYGTPAGYPTLELTEATDATDHVKWEADLKRWARAFSEDPDDVDIYDASDGYVKQWAEEKRRRDAIHQALREMEPWWDALWD